MGDQFNIDLNGEKIPVTVHRNRLAKRLILRVDKTTGEVKLTLPHRVGGRAAEKFLNKQKDWIEKERNAVVVVPKLGDGATIKYLNEPHRLVYTGDAPRTVSRTAGNILVGGPADMAPSRVEKWLRQEAKRHLAERVALHAERLEVEYSRISIGDMRSRWGSCSARGTLRFSWRLLMAPYAVMDYVAAHEVAHLREMNHSSRFWDEVAKCTPDYATHRRWLKTEGNALFQVCF